MATNTNRLLLRRPQLTDIINVGTDISDNMSILDNNPGVFLCTSLTQPAVNNWVDRIIWETDTKTFKYWDGAAFVVIPPRGAAGGDLAGNYPNPTLAFPPALAVIERTATATVSQNADVVVLLGTVRLTRGLIDTSVANRITITRAGVYLVTTHATWTNTVSGTCYVYAGVNGTVTRLGESNTPNLSEAPHHGASEAWLLAVGDYLQLYVYHTAAAARNLSAGKTFLGATYLMA